LQEGADLINRSNTCRVTQLANNMPVALVAEKLGKRSASAFTAMFRRSIGIEPRRYFSSDETTPIASHLK
jgi:AraC-like DNA-binding protein